MLLVFAMISIVMVFAGLTSAFVVSKSRPDWLKDFTLPTVFFYSTATLMLSSVTFWMAKRMVKKGNNSGGMIFLLVTLALGLLFIVLQFKGFNELYEQGLVPVGETGSVTISFLYAFVVMHIAHLSGGLISLLIVIYNHFKQKYSPSQILGIELSAIYWHFMDFIWVYLFLFFYFYK
jgi:cytochrome c oxidase subunit 3